MRVQKKIAVVLLQDPHEWLQESLSTFSCAHFWGCNYWLLWSDTDSKNSRGSGPTLDLLVQHIGQIFAKICDFLFILNQYVHNKRKQHTRAKYTSFEASLQAIPLLFLSSYSENVNFGTLHLELKYNCTKIVLSRI